MENIFLPFFLLGLTSFSTTTVWVIVLIFLASPFGNLLRNNRQIGATMNKVCGVICILLAANIGLVH